ncbi:MAG: helix-turn-helix transcriptional regulator [Clostridiales bacterium]|nr:helix-turn-helix transcriptional regulator [Clostridiales bacterium]
MEEKIYEICNNFAKNLKTERLAHNMTQKQVAEKIGIKTQSYQAYEKGITLPTTVNLLKLSFLFRVSIDELFER